MYIKRILYGKFIYFPLYLCIISIFFSDWLYFVFGIGIRYMTWTPEFFSLFLLIYIPAVMALKRNWRLPTRYTVLLLLYILHIIIGFIVNSVSTGPIIAGTRQFFRFIPIFVLPAIIRFDENDLRKLLIFLLILALIQLPVTVWQRFFLYAYDPSGDPVGGTLGDSTSGVLSIFLLIVLSLLTAFYFKKEINFWHFILLCILLFIPTTLNETKITLLLLPLVFIMPILFTKNNAIKTPAKAINLCLILIVTFFIFISIYNSFSTRNILKFYSKEKETGNYSEARIGPVFIALEKIYKDGLKSIIYGYGAGNLSVSYSENMESNILSQFSVYNIGNVSLTKMIWETGFVGTLIFFVLIAFIFLDTFKLSKKENLLGTIATGMATATLIFTISFIYTKPLDQNLFVYLFFFFSGNIISQENHYLTKPNKINFRPYSNILTKG